MGAPLKNTEMLTLPNNIEQMEPIRAFLIRKTAEIYKGGKVLNIDFGDREETGITWGARNQCSRYRS